METIPSLEIKPAMREKTAAGGAERKQGRTRNRERDESSSSCVGSTVVEGPTCSRGGTAWKGFRLLGNREGQCWVLIQNLSFSDLVFLKYQELLGGTSGLRFPWLCPPPCLGQQDPPMEREEFQPCCVLGLSWAGIAGQCSPWCCCSRAEAPGGFLGNVSLNQRLGGRSGRSCPSGGTHRSPGKVPQVWKPLLSREAGRELRHGWNYLDPNHSGREAWTARNVIQAGINPAVLSRNCRICLCEESGTKERGARVTPVCQRWEKSDLEGREGIKSIGSSFLAISVRSGGSWW